jgi:prepilin signal peptidase PulO-like enzyme (type II secretory pathway)
VAEFALPILMGMAVIGLLETLRQSLWQRRWKARDLQFSRRRDVAVARVLVSFVLAVAVISWWQTPSAMAAVAAAMWLGLVAYETDLIGRRIPREPCWSVLGISLLGNLLQPSWAAAASFATAFLIVGAIMLFLALITKGGLGSGDVRFYLAITPLAWWIGYTPVVFGLLVAAVVQAFIRVFLLIRYRGLRGETQRLMPFGPALFLGVLVTSLVWTPLTSNPCRDWIAILSC